MSQFALLLPWLATERTRFVVAAREADWLAPRPILQDNIWRSGVGYFDLFILVALAWWVLSRLRRRRREESLLQGSRRPMRERLQPPSPSVRLVETSRFDEGRGQEVEAWSKDFLSIQSAWSQGDLRWVQGRMTPGLYARMQKELSLSKEQGVLRRLDGIELRKVEPAAEVLRDRPQRAQVVFVGTGLDYRIELSSGRVVGGDPRAPVEFEETWVFARDRNHRSKWLVSDIRPGRRGKPLPRVASLY